ncbi:MAG: hypothetical protein JJV88_02295 [Sulfurovum sp.]|nr:hypothetical protein [Sulfurovaceae bacterium]
MTAKIDDNYESNVEAICRTFDTHIPKWEKNHEKEILRKLTYRTSEVKLDDMVISMKNGTFRIMKGKLVEVYDVFAPNKFPYTYRAPENRQPVKVVDDFLNDIAMDNEDIKQELLEMVGYTLIPNIKFRKGFILFGVGSNGKSTLTKMVHNLHEYSDSSAACELTTLSDNFKRHKVLNKLVAIGDDIDSKYIKDTGIIKSLISGEDKIP